MSKTHTFDDGTVVELDDDVEVEDFLELGDEEEASVHAARVEEAEAEVERPDNPDDEPAGIEVGD